MKNTLNVIAILCAVLLFASCKKDNEGASMSVYLQDAPASYDKVKIHIKGVQLFTLEDSTWVTLTANDSVYNILTLDSLNQAFIGKLKIGGGTITQVRLMIGSRDSVTIGGIAYPLVLDSVDIDKLKVSVNEKVIDGNNYRMTVDFKASESIEQNGGVYYLKASLKIKVKEE